MVRARSLALGALALVAAACAPIACAGVLGIDDPIIDLGGDATVDARADVAANDATSGQEDVVVGNEDVAVPDSQATDAGDSGTEGDADASPASDAGADASDASDASDAACGATGVPDASAAVFVDHNAGSDSSSCGSASSPCQSIQQGLTNAHLATGTTTVFVAIGTYTESLTLYPGLTIQGGWLNTGSGVWKATCVEPAIVAPATSNTTVLAETLGGAATLQNVTVQSKASANAGETIYGIFATGSSTTLTLDNVQVSVVGGGTGATGNVGDGGEPGVGSCSPPADGGFGGPNGPPGSGADAGFFEQTGYVATGGTSGDPGVYGLAGPPPTPPACDTCMTCKSGLFGCTATNSGTSCGDAGLPGCGGGGGLGGGGGTGGGSSIALYVWGATVNLVGGYSLTAGSGGNGGPGGTPGGGAEGSVGATGPEGTSCTIGCSASCGNEPDAGPGGVGSRGGQGSAGGAGGGGAGGWSCGYVKAGGGLVNGASSAQIVTSAAGSGSGTGAPGLAKQQCP